MAYVWAQNSYSSMFSSTNATSTTQFGQFKNYFTITVKDTIYLFGLSFLMMNIDNSRFCNRTGKKKCQF